MIAQSKGSRSLAVARTARFIALAFLLVSYVAWLGQEFPVPSGRADLVRALRSDDPPAVEVGYDDDGVSLFWRTAPLVYREAGGGWSA